MENSLVVHIFNPESDLALGVDSASYTPTRKILSFKNRLCLLPALLANSKDIILIPDESSEKIETLPYFQLINPLNLKVRYYSEIESIFSRTTRKIIIKPWGWNKTIKAFLLSHNVPSNVLPSDKTLEQLRDLSNRKMTIRFFKENYHNFPDIECPLHLSDHHKVTDLIKSKADLCFKAPWSSSGRGIVFSNSMPHDNLSSWTKRIIESQGGIMVEKRYERKYDFASEWILKEDKAEYLGLSFFKSSCRGHYKGNILYSQEKIKEILYENSSWNENIISIQKDFLQTFIAPFYNGPLGIDMLSTPSGIVNPCVEINLRNTMGHIALALTDRFKNEEFYLRKILDEYCRTGVFLPGDL